MKPNYTIAWLNRVVLGCFFIIITGRTQAQTIENLAASGRKLHLAPKEKTSALESALTGSIASKQTVAQTLAQQQELFQQADQEYLKLSRQINPGSDPMAGNSLIQELEAAFASTPETHETTARSVSAGWIIQTKPTEWQLYAEPVPAAKTYVLEKSTDGRRFVRAKAKLYRS